MSRYQSEDSDPWIRLMRKGNFEEAWKFSDSILQSGINRDYSNVPRHFQSIWAGTLLEGKRVLIRCYHGLGDTIQFIRYAKKVKDIAKEVIVWAQPQLLQLLATAEGIDQLLPLHDGTPEVSYDVDVEIMELPHIFRTTLSTIPSEVPYLHVNALNNFRQNDHLSVGLVWESGDWDKSRNVPFSLFEPLYRLKVLKIYILQANAASAGWKPEFGVHPGEQDLYNYARLIRSLDLLISVDSMPAHLAGALNVPVWLLLPHKADWRWMEHRADSPWYPSMKIFRQAINKNWEPVIDSLFNELQKMVLLKQW